MADENDIPNSKARVDIEARPKLTGASAFKRSLGDLSGELIEPGLVLASGGTAAQAAWAGLRGILLTRVLGPLGLISGAVVGLGAAMKIVVGQTRLMADGLREAESMESLVTMFTPLLGGAQAAKQRLAELFQFAETTPFSIKGIAEASRLLEIMTRGALSTSAGLRMIGDAAAIAGRPLEEVSFWIGRLRDAMENGMPAGEAMMRLQEMGVVSGGVRRRIEQLTEAGAGFRSQWALVEKELKRNEGGMELLSQSAVGLRSTLSDARDAMARGFGNNFLEREKDGIKAAITITEAFTPVVEELGAHLRFLGLGAEFLNKKFLQNKAAMELLASSVKGAMNAFILFGSAALAAQAAVTFSGLKTLVGSLGSLTAALKLAVTYKLNLAKAARAAALANKLNASAVALETRAKQAAIATDKARLAGLATERRALAANVLANKAAGGGMAANTLAGRALKGVLKGIGTVLGLISGAIRMAFTTMLTGIGAVASGVGLVVGALYLWHRATTKQKEYLDSLRRAQAEQRKETEKQVASIRTLQDKLNLEKKLINDVAAAYRALIEAKERTALTPWGQNTKEKGIALAQRGLDEALGRLNSGGAIDEEGLKSEFDRDDLTERMKIEREIKDIVFEAELQRAKGGEKANMLAKRREELESRIDAARAQRDENRKRSIEEKRLGAEITGVDLKLEAELQGAKTKEEEAAVIKKSSPSPNERNLKRQRIAALRAEKKELEAQAQAIADADLARLEKPEFIKVNQDIEELTSLETGVEQITQQIEGINQKWKEGAELLTLQEKLNLNKTMMAEAAADENWRNLAVQKESTREAERKLAIEQRTREIINQTGMARKEAQNQAIFEADLRDDIREAEEQSFRRNRMLEIAKSEAQASKDPRKARAIDDRKRLRELVEQNIMEGGMDPDQAKGAATRQMRAEVNAQERGKGSNIVADQFQRLGLGGFAAGSDPAQRARERMLELQKINNQTLKQILEGGGPI